MSAVRTRWGLPAEQRRVITTLEEHVEECIAVAAIVFAGRRDETERHSYHTWCRKVWASPSAVDLRRLTELAFGNGVGVEKLRHATMPRVPEEVQHRWSAAGIITRSSWSSSSTASRLWRPTVTDMR